jgi:Tfp pilus assembly protein PilN
VMVILAGGIHLHALGWENRQMRSLLAEVDQNNSVAEDLEQKMDAYNRLVDYRINVEGVLVDICRALPDNIVILSIQLSREKKLVIRGSAKDPKAVFSFADTLRKSNRLAAVQPEHTEPGRGGGFTVSAELIDVKSLNAFNGRGKQWK